MRLPGWFVERVEPTPPEEELRVSSLELFFDLVFVFTVTQLTTLLVDGFTHDRFTGEGALRVLLVFGVIWWMYAGYAWLTNTVPPGRAARRVLILLGMAGFLIMALAIPTAFDGGGVAFALGYLIIVVVHGGLYLQGSTAIVRVIPFNLGATALLLVAGIAENDHAPKAVAYLLWAVALVLLWGSPYFIGQEGFPLHPAHIVERHGLLVIVVLGESVVAIGIGAAGLTIGPGVAVAAGLGLAVAACLWWAYFGGEEGAAERALAGADVVRRTRLILGAYFYAHIPMLLGVVSLAAGIKKAIGHPADPLKIGPAVALAAGAALFLIGDAWYRRVLGLGSRPPRTAAAVGCLLTIPLGLWSAIAQLAVLTVLLVAVLGAEHGGRRSAAP
jgi:low temperature requirement protein LtrA